jgi:aromatic-L-amino-acid decarboxylase
MGLPSGSAGILTSGASMATLSALACARDERAPQDLRRGILYVTDQAHFAVAKAARLIGLPRDAVRTVATDAANRMDPEVVSRAIREDRLAGYEPFCLVASAGTTNSGAVDPLDELADITERERLWLHVDAAYGGFFQLTVRGAERLAGIGRADSLVLDPHKGLFLPFGTGCLLMRDAAALHRTHAGDEAVYFRDHEKGALPDFADLSPELTRPFRGLRLWLPMHLHGVGAFRRELDKKLDLARAAWETLAGTPGIAVQAPPTLSVVTFRADWRSGTDDRATETLIEEVAADGRLRLSTTVLDGQVTARLAILGHRTSEAEVAEALQRIRQVAASHL